MSTESNDTINHPSKESSVSAKDLSNEDATNSIESLNEDDDIQFVKKKKKRDPV